MSKFFLPEQILEIAVTVNFKPYNPVHLAEIIVGRPWSLEIKRLVCGFMELRQLRLELVPFSHKTAFSLFPGTDRHRGLFPFCFR